jgi:succinoglycan biosynthesis protein ExoM
VRALTVAVLTYRRPHDLAEGLPLILEQIASLPRDVPGVPLAARLLVVDNDAAASARETVERVREAASAPAGGGMPAAVPVDYVVEERPGIAAARDRAIQESTASDVLVFIDDDERPRPGWLAPLIREWDRSGSAAVMGRVVSEFEGALDPWVAAGEFFRRRSMPTGTRITVAAAGNLLLDLGQVRRLGVRFDARVGLGSGEDSLFSRELVRRGGTMTWCEESVATDVVPRSRMSRSWVLTRARSHGNAEGVIDGLLADGPAARLAVRARNLPRGLVRVAGGTARFALGLVLRSRRHQARGLRTANRGLGIAASALGRSHLEYARDA